MGIRGKLLGGVGASLAALVLAAVYGLGNAWLQLGAPVPTEVAQSNTVAQLTTDFRIQVQEWKNVLLRGADEAQRSRYWEAFQKSEAAVQQGLRQLLAEVADLGLKDLLAQTQREHAAMGEAYRRGFEAFVAAGADASVGDGDPPAGRGHDKIR
jgi:methyl-accepting chemotaxis protein